MIQRKQTLFLLEIAFLSISLFFIPLQFIISDSGETPLYLKPISNGILASTGGHMAAIALNALAILISVITIFLFKKRELQVKLCYALMAIYFILTVMLVFCPFVQKNENISGIKTNAIAYAIFGVCIISSALAARFVKKDIELLKSADRIR